MREILEKIVASIPGSAAVLMGFDGIAIDQAASPEAAADVESIAMEFSFRFMELRKAAESLDMGELQDVVVKAARGSLIVRCLNEEFFVALYLDQPMHLGKGRWLLRSSGDGLRAQL